MDLARLLSDPLPARVATAAAAVGTVAITILYFVRLRTDTGIWRQTIIRVPVTHSTSGRS